MDFGGRRVDLSVPQVMGVLNVTPDSFSDGGRHATPERAVAHALAMVEAGAAFIDVGGESSRPGAEPASVAEELDRVLPVLEALRGVPAVLSIDTCKPEVMRAACAAGATLVNDIRALQAPGALDAVCTAGACACLMHMQGVPRTMQSSPQYTDVLAEVDSFLAERVAAAEAAGLPRSRLLVDPGFGFGKTLAHNLALLRGLSRIAARGVPVLVGLSRKSMLGALTGAPVDQRLGAGLAAALLAVQQGAAIVRTHDVTETVQALKVLAALQEN